MNKIDIAIVGATTPIGEALLEQMAVRSLPVEKLIPLAFNEDADTTIEFANKQLHVKDIAAFNFSTVSLVFLCQLDDSYHAVVDRILDAGCRIIEIGSNLQNAPAVVVDANSDETLFGSEQHIRSASGLVVVLTQLLKPVHEVQNIKSLHFTALHSVSDKGKAGIDELAMQTTSLLNTRPIKNTVFKQQIAFNVMTDDSDINATGFTHRELDLMDELKHVLFENDDSDVSIMPSVVYMPVFYGVSVDVHLELNEAMGLNDFEQAISKNPNVELKSVDDLITPVSHAAQMDKIFVNRIRNNLTDPRHVNFWCVTDTIRSGSAINGVQIAEILVKHHL